MKKSRAGPQRTRLICGSKARLHEENAQIVCRGPHRGFFPRGVQCEREVERRDVIGSRDFPVPALSRCSNTGTGKSRLPVAPPRLLLELVIQKLHYLPNFFIAGDPSLHEAM